MHECPVCHNFAWSYGMAPEKDRRGQWHHPSCPLVRTATGPHVGFGLDAGAALHHITTGAILKSGVASLAITKVLGATWQGALVMGLGGALWEAGSGGIPLGWKRYVLGLFQKV